VIYPFYSKLAEPWRVSRVFLAGDAAHLMSPFLGEGAASGMRDAINLAWKLDLLLRGLVPSAFLDTYQVERLPHARRNIVDSAELGRITTERDPQKAAARDAFFLSGEAPPPPPEPPLEDGVLLRGPDGQPARLAGELSPQGYVNLNGRTGRMDDVVGWGFALVARDVDPLEVLDESQRAFLQTIRCAVVGVSANEAPGLALDIHWSYQRYFDEFAIEAFLARPDFYLFAALESVNDIPAAVDELRRQLHYLGDASETARDDTTHAHHT
jgi:3-(3-hydroxy-phenyl)propionate hydroxylase